jgi:predicted DNA-binding transcriptional regulator AlpA
MVMSAKQKKKATKRFLSWNDLRALGITYHSNHLRRMWSDGRFPRPVHMSPRKLAWEADAVDAWLTDKLKQANRT